MRQRIRLLLTSAVLLAPTVIFAAGRAQPPIPDPTAGDPAGFLSRFLEMLHKFVEGLIGSAGV